MSDWKSAAQHYLARLGQAEYTKQRQATRRKRFSYAPTDYHNELVRLLGRDDEEAFKALKMLQGYASALGV